MRLMSFAVATALITAPGLASTQSVLERVLGQIDGARNLAQVNGSIGDLSTTALGAVNTGTITSGVDAAVQGIVGMSGQTTSGL